MNTNLMVHACTVCRATTQAWLCDDCEATLHAQLAGIPDTVHQLEVELTRQARKTHPNGARTAETLLPFHLGASLALARLRTVLRDAATLIGLNPHQQPVNLAQSLDQHLPALRLSPEAGDVSRRLTAVLEQVTSLIDNPPEHRYIGQCVCGTHLHAPEDTEIVECPTCDSTWGAETLRARFVQQMASYLITTAEAAVVFGVGYRTAQAWIRRGKLTACGHDRDNQLLYRFGDIHHIQARVTTRPPRRVA